MFIISCASLVDNENSKCTKILRRVFCACVCFKNGKNPILHVSIARWKTISILSTKRHWTNLRMSSRTSERGSISYITHCSIIVLHASVMSIMSIIMTIISMMYILWGSCCIIVLTSSGYRNHVFTHYFCFHQILYFLLRSQARIGNEPVSMPTCARTVRVCVLLPSNEAVQATRRKWRKVFTGR